MLMKSSTQSLTEQLATRFAERIRNRLMAPGARLPSVRQCALQHDVSPSTVVAAYDQLLAQGLVEARKNRGFFVRESAPERADQATQTGLEPGQAGIAAANWNTAHWMAMRGPGPNAPPVNATALIRGMFHKISNKPQPGMGVFPPEWLESTFMPAAVRKVTGTRALQDFSLQYGEPLGDGGLRRVLAKKLASLNVLTAPEHIITTVGATHALDIVSRTLLRAGDPVMVEEPGWAVEFARLSALGMHILPVPRRADGPDLEVMAKYCEVHKPKLYVSVSVFHNPTGYCLSPGSAHRVLQLANQHDFHIVEDDTYSHIAPEHATRLSALDGLQRTIYVSGFAKILAPNWRIGFLAAPPALVEPLLDTKLLATLTTPALLEKALALCIEQGQLRRHAERIRTRLDAARARSVKLALAAGCRFAAEPTGLFGWVDTGVDTDVLAQRMLDEGYLLAPGALFHAARAPSTLMRINFATTQDAAFWRVFSRLVAQH
ncbi:GntR family transcriptional regulator [Hydrogenophaga taeniospiralis CCUG 15921]|uniref:GntR family transcriptional regulator n=1 Tax=Hydrogenophaga taeniospiralis CCUG 15921 TaxID=1281780 RepID=A0A9X4P294_9BURK|nr:PLP-dependent aminotransferase family protein [Hydrogenophaga taeniospiralis]MDG5978405.1 GntR family transcriptional regulator [Hydrogenophaga taeniospiralis CCUG 15921]